MGSYLDAPDTRKYSDYDQGANVRYVAMSMQGWRSRMEDSHIAHINLWNPFLPLSKKKGIVIVRKTLWKI